MNIEHLHSILMRRSEHSFTPDLSILLQYIYSLLLLLLMYKPQDHDFHSPRHFLKTRQQKSTSHSTPIMCIYVMIILACGCLGQWQPDVKKCPPAERGDPCQGKETVMDYDRAIICASCRQTDNVRLLYGLATNHPGADGTESART